jgi:glycosyltransferase involved in cell wall biosynthesis
VRDRPLRVALLVSSDCFEEWLASAVGIEVDDYVDGYRNDWTWTYCRALRLQGVEPVLYWPSACHEGLRRSGDGYAVRFLRLRSIYRPWLRFPVLKRTPVGRYVAEAANALAFLPALKAALAEDEIDVLYVQDYWTGRFDVLAGALPAPPIVGANHGQRSHRELKAFKRWTLPRAARFQVQTNEQIRELDRYGARADALPNFVDDRFFTPDGTGAARNGKTLLTVARLHWISKRTEDLVEALRFLPESWRLDIAGVGPDQARLLALAVQAGVTGRVRFLGYVMDREALRDRYRACDVFSLPSASEGSPLVLLEAMSCGAPVVVSDIPTIRSIVDDGVSGIVVPVGQPRALAEAIEQADLRREQLSPAARRVIEERFSLEVGGRRLAELLRAAAADPQS